MDTFFFLYGFYKVVLHPEHLLPFTRKRTSGYFFFIIIPADDLIPVLVFRL